MGTDMSDPSPGIGPDERNGPVGSPGPAGPAELGARPPPPPSTTRPPFPWPRLLYALGFGLVAWATFWLILLLLAPLHYLTLAITGRPNEELREMNLRATRYLFELLAFITG